jgi:hypothetical protein
VCGSQRARQKNSMNPKGVGTSSERSEQNGTNQQRKEATHGGQTCHRSATASCAKEPVVSGRRRECTRRRKCGTRCRSRRRGRSDGDAFPRPSWETVAFPLGSIKKRTSAHWTVPTHALQTLQSQQV